MRGTTEDTAQLWLTAEISGEVYALPVAWVESVQEWQTPTRVPRAPKYVLGVLNIRGETLPLVCAAARLGLVSTAEAEHRKIISLRLDGMLVALVVDRILHVTEIPPAAIEAHVPLLEKAAQDSAMCGVAHLGGQLVLMLDPSRLFEASESAKLAKLTQQQAA
jgi:purine-binding chemotaxis protein CheW